MKKRPYVHGNKEGLSGVTLMKIAVAGICCDVEEARGWDEEEEAILENKLCPENTGLETIYIDINDAIVSSNISFIFLFHAILGFTRFKGLGFPGKIWCNCKEIVIYGLEVCTVNMSNPHRMVIRILDALKNFLA